MSYVVGAPFVDGLCTVKEADMCRALIDRYEHTMVSKEARPADLLPVARKISPRS